ncbi:hypothetical protein SDC9_74009 [bioreactor metagenome]|uniref:Uncharacterized protein n=1 Tax=bioreactor metagenome TaxID=1076179 RepID=A0A644YGT8_9ZZZZ
MAVGGESNSVDTRHIFADICEHFGNLLRRGVADGIGQIDDGGARLNGGVDDPGEKGQA